MSLSTCCGFGWHLSQLWLRRLFWETVNLVCEGGCTEGQDHGEEPTVHGKEHPASYCPWLSNMYFLTQSCPWHERLIQRFSCFGEINSGDFCFSLRKVDTFWRESWWNTTHDLICCPDVILRYSGDPSLSGYSPGNKKPSLTDLSLKWSC